MQIEAKVGIKVGIRQVEEVPEQQAGGNPESATGFQKQAESNKLCQNTGVSIEVRT